MNRSITGRLIIAVLAILYSVSAWWSEPVTVFQSENGYNPESPLVASLSRSGFAGGSTEYKSAGLDVWFFSKMSSSSNHVSGNRRYQ